MSIHPLMSLGFTVNSWTPASPAAPRPWSAPWKAASVRSGPSTNVCLWATLSFFFHVTDAICRYCLTPHRLHHPVRRRARAGEGVRAGELPGGCGAGVDHSGPGKVTSCWTKGSTVDSLNGASVPSSQETLDQDCFDFKGNVKVFRGVAFSCMCIQEEAFEEEIIEYDLCRAKTTLLEGHI